MTGGPAAGAARCTAGGSSAWLKIAETGVATGFVMIAKGRPGMRGQRGSGGGVTIDEAVGRRLFMAAGARWEAGAGSSPHWLDGGIR
jgi:hypothetical protein